MQPLELLPQAEYAAGGDVSTIGAQIRRLARLQPDNIAVVASGFSTLSHWELQDLVNRTRAALRLAGLGCDARLVISVQNSAQAALAIVAVACSAVSIPLDPRQTLAESESCLVAIQPDAVIVLRGEDSAVRRAAERSGTTMIEIVQLGERSLRFGFAEQNNTSIAAELDQLDEPDPDAPAFILHTSGTTGHAKFIPYSHRNMLAAAARFQTWFNLTPHDRCLSVSPVFYAHGLKVTVFTPLLTGGTVTFPKDPSRFDYAEWFVDLKITWYSAGPTLHRLVYDQMARSDAKTRHLLRFILSSGAPLPREVLKGLQDTLHVPVLEHYSSTEATLISANLPTPGRSKPGTCGVPWPGAAIIVAADGRRAPAGKQGEILVGGATVTSGYLNAPELNRTRFVNGWFRTGDIGSIDSEGFLTIHGRKDDLINRGGEKISPIEIDNALMRHPAIAEAAAFALPHPRLGEDVAAAIVLRPGASVTTSEIRDFLQQKLAAFKIPRRIVFRDQLPKGQTGKIVRRRLADLIKEDVVADARTTIPHAIEQTMLDSELVFELTKMWERLLKLTPMSLDDDFFEKGGDSLLAMQMHAELEKLTGRTIPGAILFEATTIHQLALILSGGGELQAKLLVQLHANGSQTPLFFFHSEFNGEGYSAVRLARLLGSDQPFFIVDPHGLGDEPVPRSLEAMAADRLPLILNAQPDGPYRLLGSCVGGLVAFEVARLLAATGREVEMVIMVDPPAISARRPVQFLLSKMRSARPLAGPAIDRAMAWTFRRCADLEKFRNISWTRRWNAIKKRVRRLTVGGAVERSPFEQSVARRDATYEVAMSNYVPKPLSVPVIYFSVDYPGEPWRQISADLEIIKSPGNHFDLDLDDIATHLQRRLKAGNKVVKSSPAEVL